MKAHLPVPDQITLQTYKFSWERGGGGSGRGKGQDVACHSRHNWLQTERKRTWLEEPGRSEDAA